MTRPRLFGFACAALAAFTALAQVPRLPTPLPQMNQDLLPAAPRVTDWQPRGRAVVGGRIVITGSGFRPSEFEAVIGPGKLRLQVVTASSTSTRIELEVPLEALGRTGPLLVAHHLTQARTLEASYRIDEPSPSLESASAGPSVFPFVLKSLKVKVREFPGARLDPDAADVGGTCGFVKRSNLSYATVTRAADLSLEFSLSGWFEKPGSCRLDLVMIPISESGSQQAAVRLSAPFTVATPTTYSFSGTASLKSRLQPKLMHFGVGSFCDGKPPVGDPVGIVDSGGDFSIVSRGGPLDVSCTFQTKEWILPEGVRLVGIDWSETRVGNRCGQEGQFTHTFPSVQFSFARGSVFVRGDINQRPSDFVVFSDTELIVDGVSFGKVTGPRTVIKPMVVATQCVSLATPLQTAGGTSLPTIDPQSYRVTLTSLVLQGPPGLTLP